MGRRVNVLNASFKPSFEFARGMQLAEVWGAESIIETGNRAKLSCDREWSRLASLTILADKRMRFWHDNDCTKAGAYGLVRNTVYDYAQRVLFDWDKICYLSAVKELRINDN